MMRSVGLLACVWIVAACSPPTTATALKGTYVQRRGDLTDTLRLDGSGRYFRMLVRQNTPVIGAIGSWSVTNRGRQATLRDFATYLPLHGFFDPARGWHPPDTVTHKFVALPIRKTWKGVIELGDKPFAYVRLTTR